MERHEIKRLGHQGDGIAPGPVFAPLTLPGEVVDGTRDGARLDDVKIVTPSPHRVAPPCRHFKSCGGCLLQHASDDFVAEWKQDVVRTALESQGLEAEFRPMHTSPPRSRRRAGLSARRTKKGAIAGFHGRASGTIVEIPDCQLVHPDLLPALAFAQRLAILGGSRKGELSVMVTRTLNGLDIAVTGGKSLDGPLRLALAQEAEAAGLARIAWEDEVIATRMPPTQRLGRAEVSPPPGAFLQATEDGEAALLAGVAQAVGDAARVVDLFAGCGTFSLPLAERAEVTAIEGDAEMLRALDGGWRMAQGLKKVTTRPRDLFRNPLMADELARFDAAVIDPPRAGAAAQVAELAQSDLPVVAMVSCNPVTFARDARVMVEAGWRLDWVKVVDQFRWSPHVELVARLTAPHI
ncbi:class I SAM-dependent RNA methyltransferase [Lutimaribacter sp. EGI FJ00015]|uniref:Class I SAM-dependent RNA methyltransferase n=1 Tax=Lutimaribacter degradans TaxID=2945989 RepID=A0ACC5ZUD7_9RHOB|nr:class I SAM-dependent RNA methyltransferase [Lutimaribacter sp. EGI FJ00013]MCM2561949.1 class I SAM-dependent RNA methyltransferase [Lutimaribacter sp. EGI FJ00013]MCO0613019.1 class I SAM-dependent RNA methyltransferase [Lutimaribacter sp. EGI FJ00015]MCO0635781.1 class I SAM-dependent RNA methyltransferase [Lutimaribacter sp. EGI FJ00014]